jgi:fructokinase
MKLLSFGAVLWDIIEGEAHIGGAPFNLAAHAARLGMEACLVSAVGKDELGTRALAEMRRLKVRDDFVPQLPDAPTGVVDVRVDEHGAPTFTIRRPAAWDFIALSPDDIRRIRAMKFDVFCFGSLEQRSPVTNSTLRALAEAIPPTKRFCDINLRPPFYDRERVEWSLAHCDILKLNDDEVRKTCELLGKPRMGENLNRFCRWVSREFAIETVCVTLGAEGCLVHSAGEPARCAGVKVKVVDTVGAGDAFCAAFISRLLARSSAREAGDFACKIGALVASRRGAVPEYDISDIA